MQGLDLSKVKYVFVDFDNTACVHMQHHRNHYEWFKAMFEGDESFYNDVDFKPLPGLKPLLIETKLNGAKVYGLTWVDYNFSCDRKKVYLDRNYPDIFSYCIGVGNLEGKTEFVQDFIRMKGCLPESVLVIDDHPDTQDSMVAIGVQVLSASEVTVRYHST